MLQVEVMDVEVADGQHAKRATRITAKIVTVQRSSKPLIQGERIVIDVYQIVPADRATAVELLEAAQEFIGPRPLPQLSPGWQGTIYLNTKRGSGDLKRFRLAAFGHSFQPGQRDRPALPNPKSQNPNPLSAIRNKKSPASASGTSVCLGRRGGRRVPASKDARR